MSLPEEPVGKPNSAPEDSMTPLTQKWQPKRPAVAWSIAGFDPSSGAGITADLMTFAAHGFFGCSAMTALTVQNTVGVLAVEPSAPEVLRSTLLHLADDLPPRGIKIGMLGTPATAEIVASFLQGRRARASDAPVVVLDPVLRSSSGTALYPDDGLPLLRSTLLPLVHWITPNWAELGVLTDLPPTRSVRSIEDASTAVTKLQQMVPGLGVVATGGDQRQPTDLLVEPDGTRHTIKGRHIATTSTHGTGCAYSSALLCWLLEGMPPREAAERAKAYVEGSLEHAPGLGNGRGPMELLWPLRHAR